MQPRMLNERASESIGHCNGLFEGWCDGFCKGCRQGVYKLFGEYFCVEFYDGFWPGLAWLGLAWPCLCCLGLAWPSLA